jgi:hypothetical protein
VAVWSGPLIAASGAFHASSQPSSHTVSHIGAAR